MSLHKMLSRYNLTHAPFGKDIGVEDFFDTPELALAITRLKAAVEARSSAVVTGEPGSGKTCVIRALEEALTRSNRRFHYVHNSMVNPRDFYRQLSMELGLEARATAASLFLQVNRHFSQVATEHRTHSVLVLDEAHLLPHGVLSQLHILLNFQRDSKPWLSLVLVGLPELRRTLGRDSLRSLAGRISTRIALPSLQPSGVRDYLQHRLEKAGARSQIFSEDAVLLLAEATCGLPRLINEVATHSLFEGLTTKGCVVDGTAVARAVETCKEILP